MLFLSIAEAVVIMVLVAMLFDLVNGGFQPVERLNRFGVKVWRRVPLVKAGWMGWMVGLIVGILIGAANYLNPTFPDWWHWLPWVSLGLMVLAYTTLLVFYILELSSVLETIVATVLAGVWVLTTHSVCNMAARASSLAATGEVKGGNPFWESVLVLVPWLLLVGVVFSFLIRNLFYRAHRAIANKDLYAEDPEKSRGIAQQECKNYRIPAFFLCGIATVALGLIIGLGVRWSALGAEKVEMPVEVEEPVLLPEPTPEPEKWPIIHSSILLKDSNPDNDENLAENIWEEGMTPEEAWPKIQAILEDDPLVGAAILGVSDATNKTDNTGLFYSEVKDTWDAHLNHTAQSWAEDREGYYLVLSAFYAFVENSCEIEITHELDSVQDQMYVNPYSADYFPRLIVQPATVKSGHIFWIKHDPKDGQEVYKMGIRLECLNPINCEKELKQWVKPAPVYVAPVATPAPTPAPTPTPTPTPAPTPNQGTTTRPAPTTGTSHTSGGGGGGGGGGSSPVPNWSPKDPTRGTDVDPNDTPGPGPDTNNGEGAWWSSQEQSTNSGQGSNQDYEDRMEDRAEANETSRDGGESNTPSTATPPDTSAVTNEGDTGNAGNGFNGIDNPTAESGGSHEAGSGAPTDTGAVGHWEGPAD